jgi:hypothetical protein
MNNIHKHTDENGNVLILKRINKDRTAFGGFKYPAVGSVVKPETWDDSPSCGDGLHGWPWSFGLGDGSEFDIINDIWLILAAKPENVVGNIDSGAKCKCKEAIVFFEGSFHECFTKLQNGLTKYINNLKNTETTASGNSSNLAASGYYSNLAASGNGSNLAASGACSKLAASGNCSNLAASGYCSKLAASGNYSNLAASGNYSNLAASGADSVVVAAGLYSTACVGENGCFTLHYWDAASRRIRAITGYVGENGVLANIRYGVVDGRLILV